MVAVKLSRRERGSVRAATEQGVLYLSIRSAEVMSYFSVQRV